MEKYQSELAYWTERFALEKGSFGNGHYKGLMLGITEEPDDTFLRDKVVGDFGCGPRGNLAWTKAPRKRYGLDVLVPVYLQAFASCLQGHGMEYLPCTETAIPLPDNSLDVLFTINSLDHVSNLEAMSMELVRVLKVGGLFAGSFNLNEPACSTEPQNLDEETLRSVLLKHFKIKSYRLALKRSGETYKNFEENNLIPRCDPVYPSILWVKGYKKG